jgi:anaerobic magnesium-protoporphyrin IX monomethyl ester cyclase
MRILFYSRGTEQLGVECLMAYLESKGHKTELIFDPGLDNNLYYRIDILKFLNKWNKLIQNAVDYAPDLVGFSALTNTFPFAIEFASRLKKRLDVPFVFGGIHPTILPEYVLQYSEVDYVIRGEGEYSLEELASRLQEGKSIKEIKNLCYRDDGKIRINPLRPLIHDLDGLPILMKDKFYRDGAFKTQLHINTARGCPFKCTYCVNNFYRNKLYSEFSGVVQPVRRLSPYKVIEEIKLFVGNYPIEEILFADEVFVLDKKWLFEFLDIYKQQIKNITFSFCYYSKFIDEELAKRISEAGGNFAQGAIETADKYLREIILKRHETDEDILRAMKILRKYNIKVSTSAIFGIPYETPESRWKTVELVKKSSPDMVNTFLMYPFPGTEIAEIALKGGYLSESGWEKVKLGISSYHQNSLLENLDLENAATMAKLLPIYINGPRFLKPVLRRMMKMRIPKLAHFIYISTAFFVYSGWTRKWIFDLLNRFYFSLSGKKGRPVQKILPVFMDQSGSLS